MISRSATYLRPAKEADEELTPEQLDLVERAEDGDMDAVAELQELGIIDK